LLLGTLLPKELVKEQGAREQWIYLTSTQFSYLKMLAPKFYSHYITDRHRHVEVYVHNLEKEIFTLAYWSNR
jgi:hypothetical protein